LDRRPMGVMRRTGFVLSALRARCQLG
jgi:hypothetical protein